MPSYRRGISRQQIIAAFFAIIGILILLAMPRIWVNQMRQSRV